MTRGLKNVVKVLNGNNYKTHSSLSVFLNIKQYSNISLINAGVPQVGVFSPILFNIYACDLCC